MSTLWGLKKTTSASPLKTPAASVYSFTRGRPLSISSAMTPHLRENSSATSSTVTSSGRPVT